jgi:predicted nucleic acid-binding Zn finger protein
VGSRARKLLSERRLLKVNVEDVGVELTVSYGGKYERVYLLLPGRFCSCASFYFEVFSKRAKEKCAHLEALELSKGELPQIKVDWEEFKNRIFPLIFKGFLT